MSHLPINPLSPEEQQQIMRQMYVLMEKQVKSYHKIRHMGDNTSIPVELAQELMESIEYTVSQVGGIDAHRNIGEALRLGQEILEGKLHKARAMLELVSGTAPCWQTLCRWEAVSYLRRYLEGYDYLHLAHRGTEDLFYPILVSVPDGVKGIDLGLFYLNVLWMENQIMAGFDDDVLEKLWHHTPVDMLNQCEQVVFNGVCKMILTDRIDDLVLTGAERESLQAVLKAQPTQEAVQNAALCLCRRLELPENASAYLCTAARQMVPRLEAWLTCDQ